MLFNSLTFLLFFPIVTVGYYLLARNLRLQNLWLLAASLFFYSCWDWRFTFLLLVTVFVDFHVASYLDRLYDEGAPPEKRRKIVAISMGANLVILGFFKYFNFFVDSVHAGFKAMGWDVPLGTLNIVLPIGVSFYTFQSMSYTIDVYRRELPSCKSIPRLHPLRQASTRTWLPGRSCVRLICCRKSSVHDTPLAIRSSTAFTS